MKSRAVAGVLLLTAGLIGCDKVSSITEKIPFLKKKPALARPGTPAPQPSPDSVKIDTTPRVAEAPKPVVSRPVRQVSLVDEPWTPTDTGTVNPGMTHDDVVALWGAPVAERNKDTWTYLYFRNGCEVTCGTFDVVFLENGQVVDAVVRGQGHSYSGNSSSPVGRLPEASTPSSAPLNIPGDTTGAQPAPVAPAPAPGTAS